MQPVNYHPLLLSEIGGRVNVASLTPEIAALLSIINAEYFRFDVQLKQAEQVVSKRTEQLITSTSRAYSFLDSIHKGFIMTDTSGELVLTNNSLRQLLSLNNETTKQKGLTIEYISGLLGPELNLTSLVRQCLSAGQVIEKDEVNFGKLILHIYLAPLLNKDSGAGTQILGVVVLVENITEQKLLDRSKDEFLSIASHELRTPLTAIRGNAALLRKYYADKMTDPSMSEMIEDIHTSSIRLIGIVNDFLDVASIEQGKIKMNPETFAIADVTHEVVREMEPLCLEKEIKLTSDPSVNNLPRVLADRQRIKQVLINLIGNAMKFTAEGGITISGEVVNQIVNITVTDSGKGMSEESQKLLFRKFQQASDNILTRDTTKGTGLGLYISKLIVELSGGKIWLKSSVINKGSAFVFSLPINKQTGPNQVGPLF